MFKRKDTLKITFICLVITIFGCAQVNYVGKSYNPTTIVDTYYSAEEIEKEYSIIGHAIGSGAFGISNDKIMAKLIERAKFEGADGIIITELGKSTVSTVDDTTDETQIKASFIKYK
jgi:hypothetical protein